MSHNGGPKKTVKKKAQSRGPKSQPGFEAADRFIICLRNRRDFVKALVYSFDRYLA